MNIIQIKVKQSILNGIDQFLSTNNIANRGYADGSKHKQKIGLIGEILAYEYLLKNEPNFKQNGFDGGFDFTYNGYKVDVKTMERSVYMQENYVHNFFAVQKNFDADILLFCNYNNITTTLELCGWLYKKDFLTKANYYKAGTIRKRTNGTTFKFKADNYEIEQKHLIQINALASI